MGPLLSEMLNPFRNCAIGVGFRYMSLDDPQAYEIIGFFRRWHSPLWVLVIFSSVVICKTNSGRVWKFRLAASFREAHRYVQSSFPPLFKKYTTTKLKPCVFLVRLLPVRIGSRVTLEVVWSLAWWCACSIFSFCGAYAGGHAMMRNCNILPMLLYE